MNNSTCSKKWDLEERTAKFGEDVIQFCRKIPTDPIIIPSITQLVKAATSVGVPIYRDEADDAESKKDFRHKIGIAKTESRESSR